MEHYPKVAFRNIERGANFVSRALFDFIHLKYLGDSRRQAPQSEFERTAKLLQIDMTIWSKTLRRGFVQPGHRLVNLVSLGLRVASQICQPGLAAFGAQIIANLVPEDAYEPCPLRALAGKTVAGFQACEKCF